MKQGSLSCTYQSGAIAILSRKESVDESLASEKHNSLEKMPIKVVEQFFNLD